MLLATALLVAWYGVVFSVPHNHADSAIPQEKLACSASHPTSQTSHLHTSGRPLSPHPCLACLSGSTAANLEPGSQVAFAEDSGSPVILSVVGSGPDSFTHLPPLRGPPIAT